MILQLARINPTLSFLDLLIVSQNNLVDAVHHSLLKS